MMHIFAHHFGIQMHLSNCLVTHCVIFKVRIAVENRAVKALCEAAPSTLASVNAGVCKN